MWKSPVYARKPSESLKGKMAEKGPFYHARTKEIGRGGNAPTREGGQRSFERRWGKRSAWEGKEGS